MNVVLVSKDSQTLAALRLAGGRLGVGINAAYASRLDDVQTAIESSVFDVLLVDIDLMNSQECEALRKICTMQTTMAVVAVSTFDRADDVFRAVQLGVATVVSKRRFHSILFERCIARDANGLGAHRP